MTVIQKAAIVFVAGLVLYGIEGCAHEITGYDSEAAQTRAPFQTHVALEVHWIADVDDAAHACHTTRLTYGCAKYNTDKYGNAYCDIYAQKPHDFNDRPRLLVLGHEVDHCLGAEHD